MKTEPIISYAQNAEDVTLLQGFTNRPVGFYVDVGAASPVQHSVTKLFYDKGWHGINIEPIKEQYEMLCSQRQREINIQAVIGTDEGTEKLYIFPTLPGLTTTSSEVAKVHIASGLQVREDIVTKTKLDTILDKYVNQPIDFLKIDVEGMEATVLESFNLNKWKPKVLVIEATKPRTTTPSHKEWEPMVIKAGYKMVQFDGLNRFYVLKTQPELCQKMSSKAKDYKTISISKQNSMLGK
jgi:FkbM family methyltransferase